MGNILYTSKPKPTGWLNTKSWKEYNKLRAAYPNDFEPYATFIDAFEPAEVEIIMKNVEYHKRCNIVLYTTLFKDVYDMRNTLYEKHGISDKTSYIRLITLIQTLEMQSDPAKYIMHVAFDLGNGNVDGGQLFC